MTRTNVDNIKAIYQLATLTERVDGDHLVPWPTPSPSPWQIATRSAKRKPSA